MQELGGDMGVPITFLEQHNPDQFEIVSFSEDNLAKEAGITQGRTERTKPEVEKDGKCKNVWTRIVIRNLRPEPCKKA